MNRIAEWWSRKFLSEDSLEEAPCPEEGLESIEVSKKERKIAEEQWEEVEASAVELERELAINHFAERFEEYFSRRENS